MVKRKIIWSPRAKLDLFGILDFYYKRSGTRTYSRKLKSKLQKSIKLLENHSDIGVRTDIQHIRNLITANYCIFYQIKSDSIEILTIWDDRQNTDNLNIK